MVQAADSDENPKKGGENQLGNIAQDEQYPPLQDSLVTLNDQQRQIKNNISPRAGTGKRLRIGAYNTKGLRKSFDEILNIYACLDILFLSETWIRDEEKDLKELVDEYVQTPGQVEKSEDLEESRC